MKNTPSNKRVRVLLLLGALVLVTVLGLGISGFLFLKSKLRPARDPALVEVVAQFPGASAEEVERQVTIPLEVTLAGMRGLKVVRTKSVPGLAGLQAEFEDGVTHADARQEVINRLATISQPLPAGVTPMISAASSCPAIFRYTLDGPVDLTAHEIYTLNDLRAMQDWSLEREFRIVPRIVDVSSFGGTVRRYEIQPDPDRLRRYGIGLRQLQQVLDNSNLTVGGDFLQQGHAAMTVRGVGLFGGGNDPVRKALGMKDPKIAAAHLRAEEQRRLREIRQLVVANVNNIPIHVGDVVEGGQLPPGELEGARGVVVVTQPRLGQVGLSRPQTGAEGREVLDPQGERLWDDKDDIVEGVIYLRPGEDTQAAWRGVRAKIEALNDPASGRMLPGVKIEPYLEGSDLDHFWVRAGFPVNTGRERAASLAREARAIVRSYPEVAKVISEVGGPDDGTSPVGFYSGLLCVTLRPSKEWPNSARTKQELMDAIAVDLEFKLVGIDWDLSTEYREGLWGEFTGGAGEAVLKIVGPDLDELEKLAALTKPHLRGVAGVQKVHILRVMGQTHLEFRVDPEKCQRWGVSTADVNNVLSIALGGNKMPSMIEGEKSFDIAVRWPKRMRRDEQSILDIPVDMINNQLVVKPGGDINVPPVAGTLVKPENPIVNTPRLRLRDLLTPIGEDGMPDVKGKFTRMGASAIYREQGQRLILLRLGVRGRDLAAVRAEAEQKIAPLIVAGYRLDWDRR